MWSYEHEDEDGFIRGISIYLNLCQPFAPSICEASTVVLGIVETCQKDDDMYPTPRQTATAATAQMAVLGSPSQFTAVRRTRSTHSSPRRSRGCISSSDDAHRHDGSDGRQEVMTLKTMNFGMAYIRKAKKNISIFAES